MEDIKRAAKLIKKYDIALHKGTKIRDYFNNHPGVDIFNEINRSSAVDGDFMCDDPCIQTKDFNIKEQKKAYLMAILNTGHPALDWDSIPRLFVYTVKYCLYIHFFHWFYCRVRDSH